MVQWMTGRSGRLSITQIQAMLLHRKFRRAGLAQHLIDVENGQLSCWVGGKGPPLLLIQGFGASAIWQWHRQVRKLARHHTLIVPDLLYFGGSTSPKGEQSLAYQATAMLQLMDHLGHGHFSLVGISYGGFVAMRMALEHPERIDRMVINNSPGLGISEEDYHRMLKTFNVQHPREVFVPDQPDGVRRLIQIAWHRPPPLPDFAVRDAYRNLFHNQVEEKRRLLDELIAHVNNPSFSGDNLENMKRPVLIIWGQHDRVFPLDLAYQLQQKLGRETRLEVVRKTGHAPNLERPRIFNRLVLNFLADRQHV